MGPKRKRASAPEFVATVVISHARFIKRYSLVSVTEPICVEADEDFATVVESAPVMLPTIRPLVSSVAPAPLTLEERQSRMLRRPCWLLALVTAIMEPELYQVPAEKVPLVRAERRQESSAKCAPAVTGPAAGIGLVLKAPAPFFAL